MSPTLYRDPINTTLFIGALLYSPLPSLPYPVSPFGSAPAAHAPLPGAAQHPLYAANPPGLQASYPFTAAQKVSAATDATLGLSHSVLAPLTASTAIHCEHLRTQANSVSGGPPLAPALEAQRLCVAFGYSSSYSEYGQ